MVHHGLSVSQNDWRSVEIVTLTYQAVPTRVLAYIDTALQTQHHITQFTSTSGFCLSVIINHRVPCTGQK